MLAIFKEKFIKNFRTNIILLAIYLVLPMLLFWPFAYALKSKELVQWGRDIIIYFSAFVWGPFWLYSVWISAALIFRGDIKNFFSAFKKYILFFFIFILLAVLNEGARQFIFSFVNRADLFFLNGIKVICSNIFYFIKLFVIAWLVCSVVHGGGAKAFFKNKKIWAICFVLALFALQIVFSTFANFSISKQWPSALIVFVNVTKYFIEFFVIGFLAMSRLEKK